MKVAIVGVTGLVGGVMLKVMEERNFPVDELLPVASDRSKGKKITFKGKMHEVMTAEEAVTHKPDIAIFSAGGSTSKTWAPKFAEAGTTVIDNSSAWRMDPEVPLVVPEVNASVLTKKHKIIANPNCSTIQMVVALAPLHQAYGIDRLVISTYQSFTGTGVSAVKQYELEKSGQPYQAENAAYPHPIFENCLPHCDVFMNNGYTKEEMKLVNETRKILSDDSLRITATAVRVPVHGGHSESINVTFKKAFELEDVRQLLNQSKGLRLLDDVLNNQYPMPLDAKDKDEVLVGRIRRDESEENGLNMWVVADNLRKGAATNAIQIGEYLLEHNLL